MKSIYATASVIGLSICFAALGGCETDQPGVHDVAGTYTAVLDGRPDKVTNAARKAAEQMQLVSIESTGTTIDGRVTARTAQDDQVTIEITQAGQDVSKISVRVGTTGNEQVSQQLLDKIKDNLHWFSTSKSSAPEMKNVLGTYSSMVNASPDKVTGAAKKAVEDLKLTDIASSGTNLDGKITAKNAQNDQVTIDITQAGDKVSKVAIRVGTTGDAAVSRQILDKINDNLRWF